jgi:phasin protein
MMPTTEQEKSTSKQRQRNRKADQRKERRERKTQVVPDQVLSEQVLPDQALPDAMLSESVSADADPVTAATIEAAPIDVAPLAVAAEKTVETALSGEVLPPEGRQAAPLAAGPFTLAFAYGEYSRKSWAAGRFLVERLIAVRSLDEAIEVQGEIAKFAYANFLSHSQKISEFYGALAIGFFRPLEELAPQWPRASR